MPDPAISISGLGKCYRLRRTEERYTALRDVIQQGIQRIVSKTPHMAEKEQDFWALRDVSFEVQQGEVLGIIGRNGAGKSTLLKILSRITEPTEGRVTLRGRVASLLEVGTGFHPELTGRENIHLNGAILGMRRAEIAAKFDEIVAFAEVEPFLDTPVKRYSSGMHVRLAFSVAAHLEPEILVVDEVLAVGDVQFQNKCLGKMQDVARHSGRTVLFVSHNLAAVRRLCSHGVVLEKGRVAFAGNAGAAIDDYLTRGAGRDETAAEKLPCETSDKPSFSAVEIRNAGGDVRTSLMAGEPFEVRLSINNPTGSTFAAVLGVEVLDAEGVSLFTSHSDDTSKTLTMLPPGRSSAVCEFTSNPLMPGSYRLQLGMVDRHWGLVALARPELTLRVSEAPFAEDCLMLRRPGRLLFKQPWRFGPS